MFLFESEEQATSAMQNWFPKETRTLIEARIVEGAAIHVADARLLDCRESEWDANARKYWKGEMTASRWAGTVAAGRLQVEVEPAPNFRRNTRVDAWRTLTTS